MTATPCDTCQGCHVASDVAPVIPDLTNLPPLVLAASQPVEGVHHYAGTFVKSHVVADAGTILPQHLHPFPHLTFIASGACRVARDGEDLGEFHAPAAVHIPAFARHLFVTLEPATTILCIHNLADGETVEIAEEHHIEMQTGSAGHSAQPAYS